MERKHIMYSVLMLMATAVDLSLWSAFLSTAFTVSAGMVMIALFVLIFKFEQALLWSVVQGLLLDLFSTHTVFGSFMLSAVGMVLIMTLLKKTWFKQTSVITVSLISTSGLLAAYFVGWSMHGMLLITNTIAVNPFSVISLTSIVIGIIVQNIAINGVVRMFSIFQRFVLL